MPTWSFINFQIVCCDDDEQKAFCERLENEKPFDDWEGGDDEWAITIRSGENSEWLVDTSRDFPTLTFVCQSWADNFSYYEYSCHNGNIFDYCDRGFTDDMPPGQVQECFDFIESWWVGGEDFDWADFFDQPKPSGHWKIREHVDNENRLTQLYDWKKGGWKIGRPTTADIPSILEEEGYWDLVYEWCDDVIAGSENYEFFMDDLKAQIEKIFVEKLKKMAKEKLESILYSVVVLKRFVRSYVEYSNAPGGYAYKKALERFEDLAKEETKTAREVDKKTAAADSSSKLESAAMKSPPPVGV